MPHQANQRIIDAVGKRLQLPAEKVVVTVERHANTSAASIPLALDEARRRRAASGQAISSSLDAMGGGLRLGCGAGPLVTQPADATPY